MPSPHLAHAWKIREANFSLASALLSRLQKSRQSAGASPAAHRLPTQFKPRSA